MRKAFILVGLCAVATLASGQVFLDPPDPAGPTILIRGQLPPTDVYMREGLENYGNLFLSLSGINDSSMPYTTVTPAGDVVRDYGGWGGRVAGGFNIYHRLQHGLAYLNYTGSWDRYGRREFRNGTDQYVNAAYSKMLNQRWTLRASEGMNFMYNLGSTYSLVTNTGQFPSLQPYSQKTFFNSTSVTLGYQQTHHLSYFFGGDLFSALYRPSEVAGYFGISGVGGASYRFTRRTTLTGSYTLTHMGYSGGSVSSRVQTGAVTLSHILTRTIELGASAGVSQVSSSGNAQLFFQGVPPSYFVRGTYKQETWAPNFTGSIFKTGRRTRYGVSGGEGISGGNGIYLTAKNLFVNGSGNYQVNRRLSVSGLVGWSRLTSVANAAANYNATTYNLDAGYQVRRHIFANATYSGWRFPQYGTIKNFDAHRVTFGVTFATRDYPLPY